jgi:hypothetical protein
MTLTVQQALQHVDHALMGRRSEEIHGRTLINEVGEWLSNAHTWKWQVRKSAQLALRGKTHFNSVTSYTAATRTLVSTGSFSAYQFETGDTIKVTTVGSLTNVNRLQEFTISSRTDDDTIVLASPGLGSTTADNTANDSVLDWAGQIAIGYVAMPEDFQELVAYDATDSLINSLELTDLQHLLELRTNQIEVAAWNFYGSLIWFEDVNDGGQIKPRLEIWPDPPENNTESFTIFYRRKWKRIEDDSERIPVPEFMESTFIQAIRAYARGYEDDADDQPQMSARLMSVGAGPVWTAAVDVDGRIQPDYGPMRGGAVQSMPQGYNRFLRTTIAGPS